MSTTQDERDGDRWLRGLTAGCLILIVLAILAYTLEPAGDIKRLIIAVSAVALTTGCSVTAWLRKRPFYFPPVLGGTLAAYLGYGLVAGALSGHRWNSGAEWCATVSLVSLYIAAAQCYRTPRQAWALVGTLCFAVALSSLYGFCQRYGFDPFPWSKSDSSVFRAMPATYGNPNYAGHALGITLVLALGFASRKGYRRYLVLLAPIAAHLWMTQMRSGRLALAAVVLLLAVAWLVSRRLRKPAWAAVATLAIAGGIGLLLVFAVLLVSKAKTDSYLPLETSLLLRYNSITSAARMAMTHPVFGYGPGNYAIENPPFWTPFEQYWMASELLINEHVHNDVLEAAIEGGLPSAGLYIALLFGAVAYSLALGFGAAETDRRRLGFALAAFFTVFAVDGLFGFNLHVPVSAALLFVMAGVLEGVWHGPHRQCAQPSRSGTILAAVVPLLALAALVVGTGQFMAQYHLQEGRRYAGANADVRAMQEFQDAHRWAPWRWLPWLEMGNSACRLRRFDEADTFLNHALAENPNCLAALDALIRTYAGRATDKADPKVPLVPAAVNADLDRAEAAAARSLALCPQLPDIHRDLGRIWSLRAIVRQREGAPRTEVLAAWNRAKAELQDAIRYGTRHYARVQRMIAEAELGRQDADAAEKAFALSLQAEPVPETIQSFYQLAKQLNRYSVFTEATSIAVRRLRETSPKDAAILLQLYEASSDAYLAMGQTDRAESDLRKALELGADRYEVWERYARLHQYQISAIKEAVDRLAQHQNPKLQPPPAPIRALAAAGPSDAPRLLQAVTVLGQACAALGGRSTPEALARQFRWLTDMVRAQIESNTTVGADQGKALRALGALYAAFGDWPAAERMLVQAETALTGADRLACMMDHAGMIDRLGKAQEALGLVEQIRREAPGYLPAQVFHARVLVQCGRPEEARQAYESLLPIPTLDTALRQQLQKEYDAVRAK